MSESLTVALRELLPSNVTVVSSEREFLEAPRDSRTISFVDGSTLERLAGPPGTAGHVIAICNDLLSMAVNWLPSRPWLSHVVGSAMLEHPLAREHLGNVMGTLVKVGKPRLLDWLAPSAAGRRIRLTHASKRVERLDRMGEYLASKGVGTSTIDLLRDAAEELLTNAFYDAPVASGAVKQPISRTQDVALPDDSACDLVYGCRADLAIVRVRDPFGSLSRPRLLEVLTRCARPGVNVEVDETMGGAGLGLWRIFSAATFVAISVINNHHTEFLVGIGKHVTGPRPFAFHLFFKEGGPVRRWKLLDVDTNQPGTENSITILKSNG